MTRPSVPSPARLCVAAPARTCSRSRVCAETCRFAGNITQLSVVNIPLLRTIKGIDQCYNLERLWVCETGVVNLDGHLSKCKKLRELRLYSNEIAKFAPNDFTTLPALEVLEVHNNKLAKLQYLDKLVNLKRLNAAGNSIVELGAFSRCRCHSHASCTAPGPVPSSRATFAHARERERERRERERREMEKSKRAREHESKRERKNMRARVCGGRALPARVRLYRRDLHSPLPWLQMTPSAPVLWPWSVDRRTAQAPRSTN